MTTGAENRKYPLYMFDVDFDTLSLPPEPEQEEDSAPPPPTYSAAEIAAAREEGLAAGQADGIAQSNAGFENQIAATLDTMAQIMTTLEAAQRQANEDTARAAVRLALAAAAKVMPEYAKQHGMAEIEAFIAQCLTNIFEGVAVTIRVPEALAAEIGERIEPVARRSGFEDGLKLVADPELGPADCRVEWEDGGAARNAAKLTAEIDDIVEKFLQQPPTPPSEPPPPVEDAAAEPVVATETAIAESEPVPEPEETPQTEAADDVPVNLDDTAGEPVIEAAEPVIAAAEPEEPPAPAAGPVLPGAIDPAAT